MDVDAKDVATVPTSNHLLLQSLQSVISCLWSRRHIMAQKYGPMAQLHVC